MLHANDNDDDDDYEMICIRKKCPFSFFHGNVNQIKIYENCFKIVSNTPFDPWVSTITNNFGDQLAETGHFFHDYTKKTQDEKENEKEENFSKSKLSFPYEIYQQSLINKRKKYISQMETYLTCRQEISTTRVEISHQFSNLIECLKWINEFENSEKWYLDVKNFIIYHDNHHHHHHHDDQSEIHDGNNENNVDCKSSKFCNCYGFFSIVGYNMIVDKKVESTNEEISTIDQNCKTCSTTNNTITAYSHYLMKTIIIRFKFECLFLSFINDINNDNPLYNFNSYNLIRLIGSDFIHILHIVHQQISYYSRGIKACDASLLSKNTFNGSFKHSYFSNILRWKNDTFFEKIVNVIENIELSNFDKVLQIFEIKKIKNFHVFQDLSEMMKTCQFNIIYGNVCFPTHLIECVHHVLKLVCNIQVQTIEEKCELFTYSFVQSLAAYSLLSLNIFQHVSQMSFSIENVFKRDTLYQFLKDKYSKEELEKNLLTNKKILISEIWQKFIMTPNHLVIQILKNCFIPILFSNSTCVDISTFKIKFCTFIQDNCQVWPNFQSHLKNVISFSNIVSNLNERNLLNNEKFSKREYSKTVKKRTIC